MSPALTPAVTQVPRNLAAQVLGPHLATKVSDDPNRNPPWGHGGGSWAPPDPSHLLVPPTRAHLSDPLYHLSVQQPDVSGGLGLALPDVSSFLNTAGFPLGTL